MKLSPFFLVDRVSKHPLNKKQQGSKEPWSSEQKRTWEEDAEKVKKERGYQRIIPPKSVRKQSTKKPGKMITRRTKGKKTWIAPSLTTELDAANTLAANTLLVVDIEKCSNFGYDQIRCKNNRYELLPILSCCSK